MKSERVFKFELEEQFPQLPGAPIVEAVIHWVARIEKPVAPDDLRKQLTERLPGYSECHVQREFRLAAQVESNDTAKQQQLEGWRGFRLTSADKLHIAQFNRDGLLFSRLRPYDNWDAFSAEGLLLWKTFVDFAKPSEVQRLGVRFINRIEPVELGKVGKYLAKSPRCLESLGLPISGFLHQSLYDVPDHPFRINVVQTVQPPAPPQTEGFGLILDIDIETTQAFQPSDEVLHDYLSKMRWLKDKAFFSLLTKSAIKTFERAKT